MNSKCEASAKSPSQCHGFWMNIWQPIRSLDDVTVTNQKPVIGWSQHLSTSCNRAEQVQSNLLDQTLTQKRVIIAKKVRAGKTCAKM